MDNLVHRTGKSIFVISSGATTRASLFHRSRTLRTEGSGGGGGYCCGGGGCGGGGHKGA